LVWASTGSGDRAWRWAVLVWAGTGSGDSHVLVVCLVNGGWVTWCIVCASDSLVLVIRLVVCFCLVNGGWITWCIVCGGNSLILIICLCLVNSACIAWRIVCGSNSLVLVVCLCLVDGACIAWCVVCASDSRVDSACITWLVVCVCAGYSLVDSWSLIVWRISSGDSLVVCLRLVLGDLLCLCLVHSLMLGTVLMLGVGLGLCDSLSITLR